MSDTETPKKPKRRLKLGRIFGTLLFLGIVGAGLYGASWFNARRYFIIVDATEVQVRRGKMLPYGHDPFLPKDRSLRKAYQTFKLPGGMKLPRGTSTYDEWRQLDQALYRILKDAADYSLTLDNERTPELTAQYLEQMRTLPGLNLEQQKALTELERDASYVEARGVLDRVEKDLARAAQLFRTSSRGGGGRFKDGEARAIALDKALQLLKTGTAPTPAAAPPAAPPPRTLDPIQALTATSTSTASN
ncbi:MAG: hypothetical protein RIT81_40600 [Deltaproteobacteria bacterium]